MHDSDDVPGISGEVFCADPDKYNPGKYLARLGYRNRLVTMKNFVTTLGADLPRCTVDEDDIDTVAKKIAKGEEGDKGDRGDTGLTGLKGEKGDQGDQGPLGPGLGFVITRIQSSQQLTLPDGNASALYLVSTPNTRRPSRVVLTLPDAAAATNRFLSIRRVDRDGVVRVLTAAGTMIDGVGDLDDRGAYVTLVTDGVEWFVFAKGGERR